MLGVIVMLIIGVMEVSIIVFLGLVDKVLLEVVIKKVGG